MPSVLPAGDVPGILPEGHGLDDQLDQLSLFHPWISRT
jgi:hypothetical protein